MVGGTIRLHRPAAPSGSPYGLQSPFDASPSIALWLVNDDNQSKYPNYFRVQVDVLFNSLEFSLFLPVVFAVFWLIPSGRVDLRNAWVLLASYAFYAAWDWRFLSLLAISSCVDFVAGGRMVVSTELSRRRFWLAVSLAVNLGTLGFFKYFNFFVESAAASFTFLGVPWESRSLDIVLPAGISFYTFQTLSYSIDIYRGKMQPTRNGIAFFAFVSFFPQLVAGPIERAGHLLPQFLTPRNFDPAVARDGMRQVLWGLFKKCVIADNAGRYADLIFADFETLPASALWIGAFLFAVQIYGDFSGYSDIAIGVAKLFGFQLSRNFDNPYLSRSPADFWRRWHITLSMWFRDYVYIPLGGSQNSSAETTRNVLIVFLLSGLWHGAAWTFVAWGLYHACGVVFVGLVTGLLRRRVKGSTAIVQRIKNVCQTTATFLFVLLGWVLFRSPNLPDAINYWQGMFDQSILIHTDLFPPRLFLLIMLTFVIEWMMRLRKHGLDLTGIPLGKPARWVIYQLLVFAIYAFGVTEQTFIYFQF